MSKILHYIDQARRALNDATDCLGREQDQSPAVIIAALKASAAVRHLHVTLVAERVRQDAE